MNSMKMIFCCSLGVILPFALAAPTLAQPSLSSLWPVEIGRSWEFDVRVEGSTSGVETGTFTLAVSGQSELGSGGTSACFTTSVAGAARRISPQPSLLLAVPGCAFDVGVFADDEVALGVWSESGADWAWWWMTSDLAPGASFRLQINPQTSDDRFLNGQVRTLSGTAVTPAGSFTDAVIVDYLLEHGESEIFGGPGNVLGTVVWETEGWVAFVPGVGPVASEEVRTTVAIDCPACPDAVSETVTTSMELRSTNAVDAETRSFGSVKARY